MKVLDVFAAAVCFCGVILCLVGLTKVNCYAADVPGEVESVSESIETDTEQLAAEGNTEEASAEEKQTVSAGVSSWIEEHLDYLFSGGCLALSALVLLLFRRGLLPQVSSALSAVRGVIGKADEKLSAAADGTNARIDDFCREALPVLQKAEEMTLLLEKSASNIAQANSEREALVRAVDEWNALLMMVIEAARLPESVKEKARLSRVHTEQMLRQIVPEEDASTVTAEGGAADAAAHAEK